MAQHTIYYYTERKSAADFVADAKMEIRRNDLLISVLEATLTAVRRFDGKVVNKRLPDAVNEHLNAIYGRRIRFSRSQDYSGTHDGLFKIYLTDIYVPVYKATSPKSPILANNLTEDGKYAIENRFMASSRKDFTIYFTNDSGDYRKPYKYVDESSGRFVYENYEKAVDEAIKKLNEGSKEAQDAIEGYASVESVYKELNEMAEKQMKKLAPLFRIREGALGKIECPIYNTESLQNGSIKVGEPIVCQDRG